MHNVGAVRRFLPDAAGTELEEKRNGSRRGTRTPDPRIMIPVL
jgi:hypothetical protein